MRIACDAGRRILQLALILILMGLTALIIWQAETAADKRSAEEYILLAAFQPAEIIYYQKNKPINWKDYLALSQAVVKAYENNLKTKIKDSLKRNNNSIINSKEIEKQTDREVSKQSDRENKQRDIADDKKIDIDKDNYKERIKEEIIRISAAQLDQGRELSDLNWPSLLSDLNVELDSDFCSDIKKRAQYYRKLIDKYPVYIPGNYRFPLDLKCYYTDTYGADREGGKRHHQGTDLFARKGTEIFSVCQGTVERLGWNRLGGERVGVRGKDGNYYYYAHLDTINKDLYIGKKIMQGELIGTMGNTGDALTTPDHLHFGIELADGQWLNPYPLLKIWEYHLFEL